LTDAALELGFLSEHPRLNIINGDARNYIKNLENKKYDAVIVDLPEPDTFQVNRFFTSEFFGMVKGVLNEDGIFSFGFKFPPNYISDIRKKKLSTIYNTAQLYFQNVIMLPGEEAYFICRDFEVSLDIVGNLESKSIETRYISGFFNGNVTNERIAKLQDAIDKNEYINTDFEPRMMNIVFQEWFSLHSTSPRLFVIILLVLTIVYLIFMRREEYVLFSTGLVTMGAEMMVIFCFQVIYGYIYLKIGAIITVFLIGLLPGAAFGNIYKEAKNNALVVSEVILITLLLLFFFWVSFLKTELPQICFLLYCFIFSFFCGFQFPVATRILGEKTSPAAGCLAADISGAAVGTIITGTLLIPLWGIQSAIIFLVLIKVMSSMIVFKKRQRY
jgi:spermidine synthase